MKKVIVLLCLLSLFSASALSCDVVVDGETITSSRSLCSDTFDIPSGITVLADNVVLDCNTAVLRGLAGHSDIGVRVENATNVTIRNCNIMTFDEGIYLKRVVYSAIEDNNLLKNRIGIRLLESNENILRGNNDKSNEFALSSIASQFNVIDISNKRVEGDFCKYNSCNGEPVSPCVSGDYYCSKFCDSDSDSDCALSDADSDTDSIPSIELKSAPERERAKSSSKGVRDVLQNSPSSVSSEDALSGQFDAEVQLDERKGAFAGAKVLIYLGSLLIFIVSFESLKKR